MRYAQIIDGKVAVISVDNPGEGWVEVPDDVFGGFLVSGDTYTDPGQAAAEPTTLDQLGVLWDAVPAYIRGPYFYQVESIRRLLLDGDTEAAIALLDAVVPTEAIASDPVKLAGFTTGITQMRAVLA